MRVTAEAKTATRDRIVSAASRLFARHGWDGTTTRDIAIAAEVATGTLFNYFQSKEAIVASFVAEALAKAQEDFERQHLNQRSGPRSVEEDLFAYIYAGFKRLRKLRAVLASAADAIFSPLARSSPDSVGDSIRVHHLEQAVAILAAHGVPVPLPAVTMQLYWTLYLGAFAYWAADESPHQEDTLALLDGSLRLFAASLETGALSGANPVGSKGEVIHGR